LEAKIVTLIKDLQNKNMQNKSKVLEDIINSQKPHHDKSELGDNQTEKGSSSKTTKKETYPKNYAETINRDRNIYKEDYRDTPPREDSDFIIENQQIGLMKKKDLEEKPLSEYLQLPGIKLYFLFYAMQVIIFDIKL
jgi:hypothetical protein